MANLRHVTNRHVAFSTPWFQVIEKSVHGERNPYYALQMPDYVSILGTTTEDRFILVRQFRAAVERTTLEIPSGHVDAGESPEHAARREFLEETGFQVDEMRPLGTLAPDVGRESNRLWCYFAPRVRSASPPPPLESGLEILQCTADELSAHVREGRLDHALNLAVLLLAVQHGVWRFPT